jgi:hypothetical protein
MGNGGEYGNWQYCIVGAHYNVIKSHKSQSDLNFFPSSHTSQAILPLPFKVEQRKYRRAFF